MPGTDTAAIVDDYLRRLASALETLPAPQRQGLVTEVAEQLTEAMAGPPDQAAPAVRTLMDRLGPAEDLATEILAEQHTPSVRRRLPLLFAGVAVLVAIGLVLGVVLAGGVGVRSVPLTATTTTRQPLAVPQVVGQPVAEATRVLEAAGLKVATTATPSAAFPAGLVAAEVPAAGSAEPNGSVVHLSVSTGQPATAT